MGTHRGFSVPFRMDVSRSLRAGEENLFAIAVDNSAGSHLFGPLVEHDYSRPVGSLNYLGNWGGLYGHVSLEANGATLLLTDADISQRTWWQGESTGKHPSGARALILARPNPPRAGGN